MLVKFIGVPDEEHEAINMYGYHFPKGQAVDVKDPEALRRLMQHPHFAHKPEKITPKDDAQQVAELQTLVAAAVEPIEEAKAAEPEEKNDGNAQPVGDAGTASTRRSGGERGRGPGRPRKGS